MIFLGILGGGMDLPNASEVQKRSGKRHFMPVDGSHVTQSIRTVLLNFGDRFQPPGQVELRTPQRCAWAWSMLRAVGPDLPQPERYITVK